MLKVLLLSRYDRLGASSRLRFYDFQASLIKEGITVTAAPFFDDVYLENLYAGKKTSIFVLAAYYIRRLKILFSRRHYDLIWLEKEALPWLPLWIEAWFLKHIPIVIDFDDAWFHRYESHRLKLIRTMLGGKFSGLVRRAKTVIVGNDYLAAWARKSGALHIVQIPTTVDLTRYHMTAPAHRPFTIGWMGSPSSAIYLRSIEKALERFCQETGALVELVGSGPIILGDITPLIHAWQENKETEILHRFDVGIMPLTSDPWSEGKCAYKLIQYMAAGLPVIASPVGMNRQVVQHGVNGFLAVSEDDWITALKTLQQNPILRHRMGEEGRKMVEAYYSLSAIAPLLANTLREAATS